MQPSGEEIAIEPARQVEAEIDGFRATGDAPSFLLCPPGGRLPRGWVLVSFIAEPEEAARSACLRHDGDPDEGWFVRQIEPEGVRTRILARLPRTYAALHLDFFVRPGPLRVGEVRCEEIGRGAAAALLVRSVMAWLLRSPARRAALPAEALSAWRAGGVPRLLRYMADLALESTGSAACAEAVDYQRWIEANDRLDDADRAAIRRRIEVLERRPLFSVLMPVCDPRPEHLRAAIDSVRGQIYPDWELLAVDDASSEPHIRTILDEAAARDHRIRPSYRSARGGISAATNDAIARASGEFLALLDHDDLLSPHALYLVAEEVARRPGAVIVYSDEDKIDDNGRRFGPYFKPDWNPDLFLAHNLLTHLLVLRAEAVRRSGGFRPDLDGAQDWDLALRLVATGIGAEEIRHVPHILYHWRATAGSTARKLEAKPYALRAQERALRDHLRALGVEAKLEAVGTDGWRIRYPLPDPPPLVSIVVPTRDRLDLLRPCLEGVLGRSTYPRLEVIVVDNGSRDPAVIDYLRTLEAQGRVRTIRHDAPFNFARLINLGVNAAQGEVVVSLNNDVEVISPDWLEEMVGQALRPGVGAVGALLLYPDRTIQHAGALISPIGPGHVLRGIPVEEARRGVLATFVRNYSAVTGACLAVRRSLYIEAGGMDEKAFPIEYNDIDLCLRLGEAGHRTVWTPFAEMVHREMASRGDRRAQGEGARASSELETFRLRWARYIAHDPALNPNLDAGDPLLRPARWSRAPRPWRVTRTPDSISEVG